MAKSISNKIKKQVSALLSDHFEEDAFFIFGVSGGPDSMALLYLISQLEVDALIVHINYGKRGEDSDKDQELTEQMAFAWGFECCSIRVNSEESQGQNFQNWARQKRYRFFRDLKESHKADAIITAHHRDDQIETIFQKILRGSAPTSWQGMKEFDGELFRPLLSFSKKQIITFCEAQAVPYRIDKSNKESTFARNFLRHEISPEMDKLFPGWEENLLSLRKFGKVYEDSIAYLTDSVATDTEIDLRNFSTLPESVKPAILKHFLDGLGLETSYSKSQLAELVHIETLQTGKSVEIGEYLLIKDRNKLKLINQQKDKKSNFTLTRREAEKGWEKEHLKIKLKAKNNDSEAELNIDADKLTWPVTIRNWKAGDRIQPLGMKGHQKISDHLTNRKVSASSREKALVLCGADTTIYAIIYPAVLANGECGNISELAKIDSTTKTLFSINIT